MDIQGYVSKFELLVLQLERVSFPAEYRSERQQPQGMERSGDIFYCFDKGCDFNQPSTKLDKTIPLLSSPVYIEWIQYSVE